jgi:hypothetical protein
MDNCREVEMVQTEQYSMEHKIHQPLLTKEKDQQKQ